MMGIKRRNQVKIAFLIIVILCYIMVRKYLKRDVNKYSESWIVLYRILGNDLPPRHSLNQTVTNLLFILQNEPSFENVTKIWILNRIVNNQIEQTLINILNQYNQYYIRIPFDWNIYRHISYHIPSIYPTEEYFNTTHFYKLSPTNKVRLIDTLYHKKTLYVMNNNGARNFALRHGKQKTEAQWLMIFDGSCFLSQNGFDEIRQALLINGSRIQYLIVPMSRLVNNNDLFRMMKIEAKEEPQIIFRRDSTIEFLETIRYGRGPKEEILTHLGARKAFWRPFKWEPDGRKPLVIFGNNTNHLFEYAGFVFRLYSGYHPDYELSNTARACSRLYGVLIFLENLDIKLTHRKLLPAMSRINSNQCTPWSLEQIKKIVKTARQLKNKIL
jgi:hypothetical protein